MLKVPEILEKMCEGFKALYPLRADLGSIGCNPLPVCICTLSHRRIQHYTLHTTRCNPENSYAYCITTLLRLKPSPHLHLQDTHPETHRKHSLIADAPLKTPINTTRHANAIPQTRMPIGYNAKLPII